MEIACPNCNAAYRVPDALLLQRKPLRCAACGNAWVPELPAEASPLPVAPTVAAGVASSAPPPEPDPPAAPRPASLPPEGDAAPRRAGREDERPDGAEEAPRPRRRLAGGLLPLAWLLSLAVIGGTLTLLFLFRKDVAEAWRPFRRVLDLIGS